MIILCIKFYCIHAHKKLYCFMHLDANPMFGRLCESKFKCECNVNINNQPCYNQGLL